MVMVVMCMYYSVVCYCLRYQNKRVVKWSEGTPCTVSTDDGMTLSCGDIVLATHNPLGVWASLQTMMTCDRSFCMVVKLRIPLKEPLLIDTLDEP